MNLLAPISSIMTEDLITISPSDNLEVVDHLFKKHVIHHILVTTDGKLEGIISKSDYLFFKRGYTDSDEDELYNYFRLKSYTASEIMTSKIAAMEHDQRINVALAIFKENLFHAIPILKEETLVGIVTTYDFIKHLYKDESVYKSYTNI